MKSLVLTAALSVLMFNNSQAQSFNPTGARQALYAKLVEELPTENNDTTFVMPPQTDYKSFILLLPVQNTEIDGDVELNILRRQDAILEVNSKTNKLNVVTPTTTVHFEYR